MDHANRCHVWECTFVPDALQDELLAIGRAATVEDYEGQYDYQDNFRAALVADPAAMAHFAQQREAGCCGMHDFTITTPWGPAMYGFNYGH